MKILLDECIPRKFKNSLAGHECLTVPEAGLAGKRNGELLSIAEHQRYTIFLTMDKGVEYEQNLKRRSVAIMILRAKSNRLVDLLPLVEDCVRQIVIHGLR
jgi:predicted nuclease of predicted toxin-antitoxin system